MLTYEYVRPASLQDACRLLADPEQRARALAGGTDLLVELRDFPQRNQDVRYIVDLKALPDLAGISLEPGPDGQPHWLRLGALVTYSQLLASWEVKKYASLLLDAALSIGGPQIRNRGTLGGNLVTASPAGDSLPSLMVLEATVELAGPSERRIVPLDGFFLGPRRTIRRPDEIVVALRCPILPNSDAWAMQWAKLGQRLAMAITVTGAAVAVCVDRANPGTICGLRVAIASVAPTVRRTRAAEVWAIGQPATEETFAEIGRLAAQEANPIDDVRSSREYRLRTTAGLVHRALRELLAVS